MIFSLLFSVVLIFVLYTEFAYYSSNLSLIFLK